MLKKISFIASLFILSSTSLHVFSQGNLLITPIRVIFENSKQKEDLNLTNIGQDTAVYMVSFLQYQMLSDGSFKQLAKADSLTSATKYLRLFPRRIVLSPNESQTVRLQFRKPNDMKDGEYRSHLYFRAEKGSTPLGIADIRKDSTKMAVQITPILVESFLI